jgi:hypothetical protein
MAKANVATGRGRDCLREQTQIHQRLAGSLRATWIEIFLRSPTQEDEGGSFVFCKKLLVLAAVATPLPPAAQEQSDHKTQSHKYRLVEVAAFGGLVSSVATRQTSE